jgi:hypothetical protein
MPVRSAAEIRTTMEANRAELARSVDVLQGEVTRLTDWKGYVERHRREIVIGAAAVGFVLGARMLRSRRRRRSH